MEGSYETLSADKNTCRDLQIFRKSLYSPKSSSPWFDLRVFYIRISNVQVDDSTPEFLTLTHIPLSPETHLEINGIRRNIYSDEEVSTILRRDRVDKKCEEATFVSTDSIRLTGPLKFHVFDKQNLILSGVLDMCSTKKWSMNCDSDTSVGTGFLKGKNVVGPELMGPMIEVYVAGRYSGNPIVLSKTLHISSRKKQNRKFLLDAIPETNEFDKDLYVRRDLQVEEYTSCKHDNEEYDSNMYWRRGTEYFEGEDGELSWFNAGVRVGVGIGLGVCIGIGIGVGLLVRTYRATTHNFRRHLS